MHRYLTASGARIAAWRAAHDLGAWALLLVGLLLGGVTAYLIVADWTLALIVLGVQLAIPALIVLHRQPFLAVLAWLIISQFLLTTEAALAYRAAFWMVHRALPPLAVGVMLLAAMVRIHPRQLPRLGLPELALLGYLALSVVSILTLNSQPLPTLYQLYDRIFIPICLYLVVRLSAPTTRDLERLGVVVLVICLAQSVIGILSWVLPGVLHKGWLTQVGERTIGSLINAGTYTSVLIFCAVLLFQIALNLRPGPRRTLYLGTFLLAIFCVFLSFSRASWIGAILLGLGLCVLYPLVMARLGMVVLPLLLVGLSFGALSNQLSWASQRLYSQESTGSALDRLPAFFAAVRMFQAKPLFGWGYMNFEIFDRKFQGRVLDLRNDNKDHANHNAYLTILAEQGLVGLLLYLGAPLIWLIRSIRLRRQLPRSGLQDYRLLVLLWLSMLNMFIINSFSPAWVTYGLGLWWLNLALIGTLVQAPRPDGSGSSQASGALQ